MNGLEDLVRETLAARAPDVDGVQLNAPVARPVRSRRWVAVGTVVAVAAAILVAVVLVAPWDSADRRAAPAALPTPPAGKQWVSYHGITLTVPKAWELRDGGCSSVTDAPGLVMLDGPPVSTSCMPIANQTPPTTRVALVVVVSTLDPQGDLVEIDGHDAYRSSVQPDPEPFPAPSAYGRVVLPDLRVSITVESDSERAVTSVLDSIEYTPVDHYGCTAQPSGYPSHPVTPGIPQFPNDVVGVVVCEYSEADTAGVSSLLGSRPLEADDVTSLKALVASSEQGYGTFQKVLGTGLGEHVYLVTRADGTQWTLTADPQSGTVVLTDGAHSAVVPGSSPGDLPGAYP